MAKHNILLLCLLAFSCRYLALAFEPSPLQDFCVADKSSSALVNGMVCKDPKLAQAEDFFFAGLHVPGNTSNNQGSKVTPVNVAQIPGLNTFGISMARVDYAPWGLVHYQRNIGYGNAVGIAALSSQNPGVITIANAVFGSNPAIGAEVLTKAFQVDKNTVDHIQAQF
ncbi:Germin [Macleaya cordata]|uniref:Germin-like protein n=1 Tax=Macleaya cordata TaxID=56857 RepID=A0A200RDR7_MACCD|nr:Germin [Macleaya cordata]